jgi:hypothetical protein
VSDAPDVGDGSSSARRTPEPGWILSRREDALVFVGTAALSLALLAAGYPLGLWERPYPLWAWLATVLFVDVAHVWSTVFRVYLDPIEVRRRPWLYTLAPALSYLACVLVYQRFGHAGFWRALAYVAVWHFVRQQAGWIAIYHRLRGESGTWDARLDKLAVYTSMLAPIVWWHAHLPRAFDWFLAGDFVGPWPSPSAARAVLWAQFALMAGWCARQLWRWAGAKAGNARPPNPGVAMVLLTTWACWNAGIVATNNDWSFTVTNVLIHGVPYLALLWRYARNRYGEDEATAPGAAPTEPGLARRVALAGAWSFVALLVAIALAEEFAWDQLAWHERVTVFGDLGVRLSNRWLAWVVPLLALPQVTHYVLDGFLWKGGAKNPGLARVLGFFVVTPDRSLGSHTER